MRQDFEELIKIIDERIAALQYSIQGLRQVKKLLLSARPEPPTPDLSATFTNIYNRKLKYPLGTKLLLGFHPPDANETRGKPRYGVIEAITEHIEMEGGNEFFPGLRLGNNCYRVRWLKDNGQPSKKTSLTIEDHWKPADPPSWDFVGTIVSDDPINEGGGLVYEDLNQLYEPEMSWYVPRAYDEVEVFRFKLSLDIRDSDTDDASICVAGLHMHGDFSERLSNLASFCGISEASFYAIFDGSHLDGRPDYARDAAKLFCEMIRHFGATSFEKNGPSVITTKEEAYRRMGPELSSRIKDHIEFLRNIPR